MRMPIFHFTNDFIDFSLIFSHIFQQVIHDQKQDGREQSMQKGRPFTIILTCIISLGFFGPLRGQQNAEVTWSDGDPTFTEPYETKGVVLNGFVELISTSGIAFEPADFKMHLSGIDRIYDFGQMVLVPEDFKRLPDIDLYLITDAFQRRVFVIRPGDGVEVAEFRGAPGSPEALERPVAARAFLQNGQRKVLVTDQGSHRVLIFDYDTRLLEWTYGSGDPNTLNSPMDAVALPDSEQVLICDTGNNRLVLVSMATNEVVWTWGQDILSDPVDVEWKADTVLVTDRGNHRVLMIDRNTEQIIWQFGGRTPARSDSTLNAPQDAQFVARNRILIADAGNRRLVMVNENGILEWEFLTELDGLKSAAMLPDRRILAISENRLMRLGYSSETFESTVHDLGQQVNFDSLSWEAQQPAGTAIAFQFRTANSLSDLEGAPWLGPEEGVAFYQKQGETINPVHDGHRFYQYRVIMTTNDPLQTPILTQVNVYFHFFNVVREGILTSPVIADSAGMVVTSWEKLTVNTNLPSDPLARDDIQLLIQILDGETDELLQSFETNTSLRENEFLLRNIAALKTRQSIRLRARFLTNNSAVSPQLDFWSITWKNTPAQKATIRFTDEQGEPIAFLRVFAAAEAGQNPPRTVFISLQDANLIQVQNAIEVELFSKITGDRESVTLELKPTGEYVLSPGLPAVIQEFVAPNNGLVEVADRDTLVVRYTDPTTASDVATDSLVVLQYTTATLSVENARGEAVTVVSVGDTLYVRLSGEKDHDFTAGQDTVFATLFDNVTDDVEQVLLIELPDSAGQGYTSGNFLSATGIPLRRSSTSVDNDGFLQTLPGHQIGASYIDNENLVYTIQVRADSIPPPPVVGEGAFDFLFAPNPYIVDSGSGFRLRICAFTGDLTVERVEIYTLAGDKIRTLAANSLGLDAGTSIARGTCSISNNWWDRRTENGLPAGSGTYWAKFYGTFTDATGKRSAITFLRKFVLVQ